MHPDIKKYNESLPKMYNSIAENLATIIIKKLPNSESKIWHRHPVWFIDGNPIVGYNMLKNGLRLLFWSGVSFE